MDKAYLGLGTNIGEREKNLRAAVAHIKKTTDVEVTEVSSIYETEPWGYEEQNQFLNLCLKIKTDLKPQELLEKCQQIEKRMGRKREEKWGPRIIDIDILIYDNLEVNTSKLVIPHPRIQERAFVLVPLQELDSNLMIKGKSIAQWLEQVSTSGIINYSSY
ncbi:2-amino-4-hydroxy-6-hydroxymethyldihydropteridine diphosphokinase [Halanaerobacter jeridensis]|uniref:2-amino-4-hydroxy-6-hydroxymethyldihydropteridine diphosphokinase n=1 Tax=Halanaerobacter jeridensis TaxID=706427 RepID=A0A939BPH5_9FIRM|nr:2-amino-4-hydroxy-6-hydroxymethyldihydropteridine diphosphokinase [Halanaerobacter jeridensis]MBM7555189.1 2-amino-4-hydroxy-6-hydroxymethyldihydropteridine diphosphokinase [Halanaerobacter jeridensis]